MGWCIKKQTYPTRFLLYIAVRTSCGVSAEHHQGILKDHLGGGSWQKEMSEKWCCLDPPFGGGGFKGLGPTAGGWVLPGAAGWTQLVPVGNFQPKFSRSKSTPLKNPFFDHFGHLFSKTLVQHGILMRLHWCFIPVQVRWSGHLCTDLWPPRTLRCSAKCVVLQNAAERSLRTWGEGLAGSCSLKKN